MGVSDLEMMKRPNFNKLVPKNIPGSNTTEPNNECTYSAQWAHDGICARRMTCASSC